MVLIVADGGPRRKVRPSCDAGVTGDIACYASGPAMPEGHHRLTAAAATLDRLGTTTRLPPVNARQANVGPRGQLGRHLPDRGQATTLTGAKRGQHLPDRVEPTLPRPLVLRRSPHDSVFRQFAFHFGFRKCATAAAIQKMTKTGIA